MGQVTKTNFGLTKIVTLTNAQVINLPSTPIELIAAIPGAIVYPISAWMRLTWVADYGAIDAASALQVCWGFDSSSSLVSIVERVGGISELLSAGKNRSAFMGIFSTISAPPMFAVSSMDDNECVNVPVVLALDNGGGAATLSGGNAGNSLKVAVFYNVFEV